MKRELPGFRTLALKAMVTHTVTYLLVGALAAALLDYAARLEATSWMRSIDDPLVMAGPFLQPIRGLIFALVFYPFRGALFGRREGWLMMWWMLVGLGILSTFAPALGSVEGLIYTNVPVREQLLGLLEIVPQALLFSFILHWWVRQRQARWLSWTMGVLFVSGMLLLALGLAAS